MNVDPAASMRCWAIDVQLGDRTHTLPPMPAADWWPVLLAESPLEELLLLFDADDIDLDERLLGGSLLAEQMTTALTDAVEQAAGRTLYEAVVIAQVAQIAWAWVGGQLARYGFRWDSAPLGAALDAVHGLFMEKTTDEFREKYEAALKKAVPAKVRKADQRKALSEFEQFAGPKPTAAALSRSSAAPSAGTPPRTPRRPPSRRLPVPPAEPTSPPG